MYKLIKGNLLEANCEALVNTVNCKGVMSKGIALAFKHKYPLMFAEYSKICERKRLKPGTIHHWKAPGGPYVLNFPTKDDWRKKSEYKYLESGLLSLDMTIRDLDIKSVAIPALGCANGGLEWSIVKPMITRFHDSHWEDVEVHLYEPH